MLPGCGAPLEVTFHQTCINSTISNVLYAERFARVDVTFVLPDTELWRWEVQPVISSSACQLSSAFRRSEEAREGVVEERRSAWVET